MAKGDQRGSALVESLPAMMVLVVFVSGVFLASYLLFAHAWIRYQSEQALYCSLKEQMGSLCRIRLENQLREFLPWGEIQTRVSGLNNDWMVEVQWRLKEYQIHARRHLDPDLILANEALRY